MLYQLSKNSNYYFYREFIRELSKDLKQKPKQSLSGSSGTNYQSYIQSISVSAILTIRPSRPGPMAPPHSRVYLFFEFLNCIVSYNVSKIAQKCQILPIKQGNFIMFQFSSPFLPKCTGFTPPPPNQIIEDSFRGPPNNCHIFLGGPPQAPGPRAPKLLKMALLGFDLC